MATLVPSGAALRSDFNRIAVDRDKSSDGWIGDASHSASVSDHNPDADGVVHAIDVDEDLRTPGLTMEACVQHILKRCESGAENRLKYIIYERRIWEASRGWRERAYSGPNAHDKHAHFSFSYTPKHERDTRSWDLEGVPVALTDADKDWLERKINAAAVTAAKAAARQVWQEQENITVESGKPASMQRTGSILRYVSSEHHEIINKLDALAASVASKLK
jgi:hypothetical protein